MEPRTIADLLRSLCGSHLQVPEGPGWQRMPCPFCGVGGDRPPGVVHWDKQFLYCHACEVAKSVRCHTAFSRFRDALHRSAWSAEGLPRCLQVRRSLRSPRRCRTPIRTAAGHCGRSGSGLSRRKKILPKSSTAPHKHHGHDHATMNGASQKGGSGAHRDQRCQQRRVMHS